MKQHPHLRGINEIGEQYAFVLERGSQIRHISFARLLARRFDQIVKMRSLSKELAIFTVKKDVAINLELAREISEFAFEKKNARMSESCIDWPSMAMWAYSRDCLVIRMFGEFDDLEAGIDIIGKNNRIREIELEVVE